MIDTRNYLRTLEGRPLAVLGLGLSNRAALASLTAAGAAVVAWDDRPENREGCLAPLRDFASGDMAGFAALLVAPGIGGNHPAVQKARQAGLEIYCDLEILHRCGHGRKTIGITGTNGKSTTTALTGHILNACGISAAVGGNIGRAALDLEMPPTDGAFVLEISSYQAELCPSFAPAIAVHLNLSPDHLDRHGSMEGYAAAKARIFRGTGDAVIGIDDEWSQKILAGVAANGERRCIPVSIHHEVKGGVFVLNGHLFDAMDGAPVAAGDLAAIATLRGDHNHQNAAASYAACRLVGLAPAEIMAAMREFPGLPHRQFTVRTIGGVAYVNDSKATNADAAMRALACYRNIYWIAGGKPKTGGLAGVESGLSHVRHAFLIGEAMDEFSSWLDRRGVSHNMCGTMEAAVAQAHAMAQAGRGQPGGAGTVLLSPACASFDQFRNFEHRGDVFAALVKNIKEEKAA